MQVNMHEAKTRLSQLGERVLKGETVVIAKAGKPLFDLVSHRANHIPRKPGRLKGQIELSPDFDETPEDLRL
jgi:prevent-host-death family protein